MRLIDLSNKHFGRLTVFERSGSTDAQNKPMWVCLCDCLAWVTVRGSDLKRGNVRSCGCLLDESRHLNNLKHGCSVQRSISSEYTTWQGMKHRCLNPKDRYYSKYGGRGITVCAEWSESFEQFLKDMGPRPFAGAMLERKENDKGYSKANCCWATAKQQARNKSNTAYVIYEGNSVSVPALADIIGMSTNKLSRRLRRGWSVVRAVTQPERKAK